MGVLRRLLGQEPDGPGTIDDPRFGPVLVTPGTPYRVEAPGLGALTLDAGRRRLRVGEQEGRVRPSRAVFTRRSENVRVAFAGRDVHLEQRSRRTARLSLDGVEVARLRRLEKARAHFDPWRETYTIAWDADVEPAVALIGHALASRYGVGAPGFLLRFAGELASG